MNSLERPEAAPTSTYVEAARRLLLPESVVLEWIRKHRPDVEDPRTFIFSHEDLQEVLQEHPFGDGPTSLDDTEEVKRAALQLLRR